MRSKNSTRAVTAYPRTSPVTSRVLPVGTQLLTLTAYESFDSLTVLKTENLIQLVQSQAGLSQGLTQSGPEIVLLFVGTNFVSRRCRGQSVDRVARQPVSIQSVKRRTYGSNIISEP